MWAGDSPDGVLTISDWAEWNAVALYRPVGSYAPGEDAKLMVFARVSRSASCRPNNLELSAEMLLQQLNAARASMRWMTAESEPAFFFGEVLRVHYGDKPLPRFGSEWSYGDLHYHSQGTDNEGEMGVSYRGTIQAMKAMGLDFVFATEHASDSEQLVSAQRFSLDDLPRIVPGWLPDSVNEWVKNKILDFVNSAGIKGATADFGLLRDMNHERFAHLHDWLTAADGVNAQVAQSGGSSRTPQIFLGGEVDAIPEMSTADKQRGGFAYGFGEYYGANSPCFGVMQEILDYTDFESVCFGNLGSQSNNHEGVVWSTYVPGPGAAPCIESFIPIKDSTGRVYCPVGGAYSRARAVAGRSHRSRRNTELLAAHGPR